MLRTDSRRREAAMSLPRRAFEAADALARVASGESRLVSGEGCYSGECEFATSDGWSFVFFVDCGELDYLESAVSPTGERVDAEELIAQNLEPVRNAGLLSAEENGALEYWLKHVRAADAQT